MTLTEMKEKTGKSVWLVYIGAHYTDSPGVDSVFHTKKAAMAYLRCQGFRFEDQLLVNEKYYATLEKYPVQQ
jgi:hypothetical protein